MAAGSHQHESSSAQLQVLLFAEPVDRDADGRFALFAKERNGRLDPENFCLVDRNFEQVRSQEHTGGFDVRGITSLRPCELPRPRRC